MHSCRSYYRKSSAKKEREKKRRDRRMALERKKHQQWRFAVLKTGHESEYIEQTLGGYAKMLQNFLKDGGEKDLEEQWDIYSVIDGDFSFEAIADSYDGFVITGSSSDAHSDDVPWILHLSDVLNQLYSNQTSRKQKFLGICFGHQILARALGGKTGRAAVGWELGIKSINLDTKLASELCGLEINSTLNAVECHRDQVLCVPPGALILASSEKTKIEMFIVGDNVLGIQCHPEFSKDVVIKIIDDHLSTKAISVEVANSASNSCEVCQPDQEPLRALCKAFLKGNPIVEIPISSLMDEYGPQP